AAVGLVWAWQTHPLVVILAAVITVLATAGLLWRRRLRREATVLYRHYFYDWVPASAPQAYYGITGRYGLRCGQHADGSEASLLALFTAFTAGVLLAGSVAGQFAKVTAQTGATVVQQGANTATNGGPAGRR